MNRISKTLIKVLKTQPNFLNRFFTLWKKPTELFSTSSSSSSADTVKKIQTSLSSKETSHIFLKPLSNKFSSSKQQGSNRESRDRFNSSQGQHTLPNDDYQLFNNFRSAYNSFTPYQKAWTTLTLAKLFMGGIALGAGGGFLLREIIDPWLQENLITPLRRKLGTDYKERINIVVYNQAQPTFIGRTALKKLEEKFMEIKDDLKMIVITGVSGSGKTELARDYAAHYSEVINKRYPNQLQTIQLFDARNVHKFEEQYRQFAEELGIDARETINIDNVIINVNRELSESRPYFLFIFDNIDSRDVFNSIQKFVPNNKIPGRRFYGIQYEKLRGQVTFIAQTYTDIPKIKYLPQSTLNLDISKHNTLWIDEESTLLALTKAALNSYNESHKAKRYTIHTQPKEINLNQEDYKLSDEEVAKLFDKAMGGEVANFAKGREFKALLADNLGYLPFAIQRAAAYIKLHGGDDIKNAITNYIEQFKQAANLTPGQKLTYNDGKLINETVNQLAIKKVQADKKLYDLLTVFAVLKSDMLNELLLFQYFATNHENLAGKAVIQAYLTASPEFIKFLNTIEVLENYQLLSKKDNQHYYIHSSVQDALLNLLQKEKDEKTQKNLLQMKLEKLVKLMSSMFTRDNATNDKLNQNSIYIPHIENIEKHVLEVLKNETELKNKTSLTMPLIYGFICAASYYTQTGKPVTAKRLLQKALDLCAMLCDVNLPEVCQQINFLQGADLENKAQENIRVAQELCKKMVEVDKKLPTLLATTLYSFGRIFFYTQEPEFLDYSKRYLQLAATIRDEIDADSEANKANKRGYEDDYNEKNKDSLLVIQNGVTYHLLESVDKKDLEKAERDYVKLYSTKCRHAVDQEELRNKRINHLQLARTYQKLGGLAQNALKERTDYFTQALNQMYKMLYIIAHNKETAENLTSYKIIFENIDNLIVNKSSVISIRMADYYNSLGKILADEHNPYQDLQTAEAYFIKAKAIEKKANRIDFPLADAYSELAKIALSQGNFSTAQHYNDKAIAIQLKLKRSDNHPSLAEAKVLTNMIVQKEWVTHDISTPSI